MRSGLDGAHLRYPNRQRWQVIRALPPLTPPQGPDPKGIVTQLLRELLDTTRTLLSGYSIRAVMESGAGTDGSRTSGPAELCMHRGSGARGRHVSAHRPRSSFQRWHFNMGCGGPELPLMPEGRAEGDALKLNILDDTPVPRGRAWCADSLGPLPASNVPATGPHARLCCGFVVFSSNQ